MAQTTVAIANKPAWIELTSSDPEASRKFYADLFGWSYPPGGFDSIQLRETDVQHNQVRLQFFGLLNGF